MYEDDLSDLLPRAPNRQTALSGFGDDTDPFQNPFGGGSDPWATGGQSSAATYDAWNTNAFADEASIAATQDEKPGSPDVYPDSQDRELPTLSHAEHSEEQGAPEETRTPPTEKGNIIDPLDAALSNVEEEPVHVPVFKRKLPLVMNERPASIAEPSPTVATPRDPKEEKEGVGENQDNEEQQDAQKSPEATPTPTGQTAETPVTPTLIKTEPATIAGDIPPSVAATPANVLDLPVHARPVLELPSSSPSTGSFSGDNNTPPSREPSTSDADGKSSLEKVAISPLERTPSVVTNPLDRNYSAPVGLGVSESGGWGDSWNPGDTGGTEPYGYSSGLTEPQNEHTTTTEEANAPEQEEEDPEDDVPLAQSIQRLPAHMFLITVGDPQKIGDPISAHIIYTVHTKTTNQNYKKSQFSVLRRYSDFVWLYDTLCANNPGVIVPPIPEKNSLGRFQDAFVEARRLALNKCLQKMANHPGLCNDKGLQLFLESDNFALDIKHRRGEENTGLLSILSTTISSSKFYETDEWFETKKVYLDGLESQLKGLVRSMEAVGKQRAEFSIALAELADTMEALSTADISKQLSSTFTKLAALQRKARELQDEQAQQDVVTFAGTVEEYGRMIGSVRMAFASRVKCYGQWQNAESEVRRVKANHDKARKQSKTPERLHYHMQEVADAERKALHTKSEFERVTKLVKIELHRFDMERVEDFKGSLEAFLAGMIRRQKELIRVWEEYQASLLQRSVSNSTENAAEDETPTVSVSSTA